MHISPQLEEVVQLHSKRRIITLLILALSTLTFCFSAIALAAQNETMNQNMTEFFQNIPWLTPFVAGSMLVVCVLVPIIWLIISVLIGIWVYKDAEKRGESGALWLIIIILTSIIGLIIWMVVRPPVKKKSK